VLPNPRGYAASLVPASPGNRRAARFGVYSERLLAPAIAAHRELLLALPHVAPVDGCCGLDERGHEPMPAPPYFAAELAEDAERLARASRPPRANSEPGDPRPPRPGDARSNPELLRVNGARSGRR
jgi:hypothetical protein